MVQKRQTEEDRIQLVNDMLVEQIMGWRVSGARYYKSATVFISKRTFDPMRKVSDAMSLVHHARLQYPHLAGDLHFKCDDFGGMTFKACVYLCAGQTGCATRPWASTALSEALARAYCINVEGGAL